MIPRSFRWATLVLFLGVACQSGTAAEPRILKVLPHLMDPQSRISVYPGLFERDGYQRRLREGKIPVSGVRFDVQWEAGEHNRENLKIVIWARTAKSDAFHPLVLEADTRGNRRLGGWSSVILNGEKYREAGQILAWRVVLLDGNEEIAEQKSFLW